MPNHEYGGSDPLTKAQHETGTFNALWLKSDRKMKPVQAIGFTILNLAFVLTGLFFAQGIVGEFRSSYFLGCLFAGVSAGTICVGIAGLVNIFKSL